MTALKMLETKQLKEAKMVKPRRKKNMPKKEKVTHYLQFKKSI